MTDAEKENQDLKGKIQRSRERRKGMSEKGWNPKLTPSEEAENADLKKRLDEKFDDIELHDEILSEELNCYIDPKILPLIEQINKLGCKTFQCCQGTPKNSKYIEQKAFIILERKTFSNIRHLLPSNIDIEIGTSGYMITDYHDVQYDNDYYLTISFNSEYLN